MMHIASIDVLARRTLTVIVLALLLLAKAATNASPTGAVQTAPHDFPLYYVGADETPPPQMVMRVNFVRYPVRTSFRSFLAPSYPDSPERLVAHYVEVLETHRSNTKVLKAFYEKSDAAKSVSQSVGGDQDTMWDVPDMRLDWRYDVGNYTYISGTYIRQDGVLFPGSYWAIHHSAAGYRLTIKGLDPVSLVVWLFNRNDWALTNLTPGWDHPPARPLKYSYRMPQPYPGDDPRLKPMTIFFNGTPSRIPIDANTRSTDPITTFIKHAVWTYQKGSLKQWLQLWTWKDDQEFWESKDPSKVQDTLAHKRQYDGLTFEQVFSINFGPNAIVYLLSRRNSTAYPLDEFLLWRGKSNQWKLTQGVGLAPADPTISGNVESLLEDVGFEKHLLTLIPRQPRDERQVLRRKNP